MGIAERKERKRAELRELILAAARRLVVREGFDGLTMRKIADAIEYSPATLYLYFPSREAIGQQLCAEAFEHLLRYVAPVSSIADPLERLREIGRAYVRFGSENQAQYRLIFMTDATYLQTLFDVRTTSPHDPGARAFTFVVNAVAACQSAGSFARGDATTIAEAYWSSLHGIVSLSLTCPGALSTKLDELTTTMIDTFAAGLATAPRGVLR